MKGRTITALMMGVGIAGLVGLGVCDYYQRQKPKLVHTLNGYYITKDEGDKGSTVYSYEAPVLWKKAKESLYLGLGNETLLDDRVYTDYNGDGKVDVIKSSDGIRSRPETMLEELLNIVIGSKDAFKKADETLEKYKQEFEEYILEAEKDRLIMMGFD